MEYYRLILYILFGVLPSLTWLAYYLRKDCHPEPAKTILRVFLFGCFITIPVFFVQVGLSKLLDYEFFAAYPLLASLLKWFIIISLTEEIFKYLVVRQTALSSQDLDEPLDVMLYMVVSALGFAAVENVLYLFSPIDNISFDMVIKSAVIISFIRFIGATFLHTLCSAFLGYFLAMSFLKTEKRLRLKITGFAIAILLHGLYDFSIMILANPFNFIIPVFILIGLAVFIFSDFERIKKIKSICKVR